MSNKGKLELLKENIALVFMGATTANWALLVFAGGMFDGATQPADLTMLACFAQAAMRISESCVAQTTPKKRAALYKLATPGLALQAAPRLLGGRIGNVVAQAISDPDSIAVLSSLLLVVPLCAVWGAVWRREMNKPQAQAKVIPKEISMAIILNTLYLALNAVTVYKPSVQVWNKLPAVQNSSNPAAEAHTTLLALMFALYFFEKTPVCNKAVKILAGKFFTAPNDSGQGGMGYSAMTDDGSSPAHPVRQAVHSTAGSTPYSSWRQNNSNG